MQYKITTFMLSEVINRGMEVSLNALVNHGWRLFQTVAIGNRVIAILQREDNE